MTTQNIYYFTTNPTSTKGKPSQSQSPLQKTQYYKFITENSHHQAQQTLKESRIIVEKTVKEPHIEKQEEFKREIERRFHRSIMNPSYKFPRHIDHLNTDSLNDSSTDSLEQLSTATKYDLHSQNLRSYAKSQDVPTMTDPKKTILGKSEKLIQQSEPTIMMTLQIPTYFDLCQPLKTVNNHFDTQLMATERVKTEFYNDQSNITSRETIATNDTAFSPMNRCLDDQYVGEIYNWDS